MWHAQRAMAKSPVRRRFRAAARASSKLGRGAASDLARQMRQLDVPWARSAPAQLVRGALLLFVLGPMIAYYVRARRRGQETFLAIEPPVVLVANHASHLDTPTILRAMPRSWRRRTIVAAAADHFYQRRSTASGVSLLLNTVPVSRSGGGADALEHISELVGDGWNLLIYAEGTRSRDGELGRMRSGAALLAQRTGSRSCPCASPARTPRCRRTRRGRAGCGGGGSAGGTRWRSRSGIPSRRWTARSPPR